MAVIAGPASPDDIDVDRMVAHLRKPARAPARRSAGIDTAPTLAGLDSALADTIIRYADEFASDTASYRHYDASQNMRFAATLGALVRPTPAVGAGRRIARLLTADRLLDASDTAVGFSDDTRTASRARLAALGASFAYDSLDQTYGSTHG